METVGERACYVVALRARSTRDASLYSGTRVDRPRDASCGSRCRRCRRGSAAPVVSNEEIQTFAPVADVAGREFVPASRAHQPADRAHRRPQPAGREGGAVLGVRGERRRVRRAARRRRAASDRIMYRDTDQGLRYYVKRGERARRQRRLTTSAKALAMGVTIDPSFDFPLPIVGINYLDFDFWRRDRSSRCCSAACWRSATSRRRSWSARRSTRASISSPSRCPAATACSTRTASERASGC